MRLVEDENLRKRLSGNARERAGKYASIYLTGELDTAIHRELLKESGLADIPSEIQDTLTQPEYALKSWSVGTSGIVATTRRIFIKRGVISKSVLDMSYQNIKAIEHMRRYPWKIPVTGAILSCLVLLSPSLQYLFSADLINAIQRIANSFIDLLPPSLTSNEGFLMALPLIPLGISLLIFIIRARTGFRLYSEGIKPLYLSGRFRKAVEFIRGLQDRSSENSGKAALPENVKSEIN